jgi:hypothetical protein
LALRCPPATGSRNSCLGTTPAGQRAQSPDLREPPLPPLPTLAPPDRTRARPSGADSRGPGHPSPALRRNHCPTRSTPTSTYRPKSPETSSWSQSSQTCTSRTHPHSAATSPAGAVQARGSAVCRKRSAAGAPNQYRALCRVGYSPTRRGWFRRCSSPSFRTRP